MAALKAGDVVITPKLDRMFRSASDALRVLEDLKRRKVSLVLLDLGGDVTGDGIARLVFTILSAVAQFERERIGERIAEMKAHLKEHGRYLGGARPFGYRVSKDGTLEPDATEQKAIATMRGLKKRGLSLRAIAERVQEKGFSLSHVGVQRVLAGSR